MTAPKQWAHGDRVTHTEMNKYGTALTEAHDSLGDAAVNPLNLIISNAEFCIRHTYRYLHYTSVGELVDPAGLRDNVALSEDDEINKGVLDLESLGWLSYGAIYYVTGVSACTEDWEA